MTGWSWTGTRHIPEDELHPYVDQALSRSQCVEIECHLAECRQCQKERDRVAALRDRITALLADAEPRRVITPPPFEQLVARRQARAMARRVSVGRLARVGLAAASLAGAVAAGWWTRGRIDGRGELGSQPTEVAVTAPVAKAAPAVVAPPTEPVLVTQPVAQDSAKPEAETRTLAAVSPVRTIVSGRSAERRIVGRTSEGVSLTPAMVQMTQNPMVQVSTVTADEEPAPLDGLWQSVGWQEASTLAGGSVPRIDGLPVLDVQVQRGLADERPLVVVAQRHPSGHTIRTIEGPYDRVAALLDKELARGSRLQSSSPTLTPPDYIATGTDLPRRGLRVLAVTGNLSADSLNALARGIDLRQ